ncbi:T9SS type A sorting domain-containing protein [Flammeovirga kamogawensis]|uniref:T9SS type A sorting domain-containing protein n=1 Tax=Flammeovirga kamogawensis TaxID=373891 RepID=A0ABX8H3R8_9BACT|nr:T9SS type A sorting domain-containing protein [Flammeovirga kamogawensis]MBB6461842.1 hypothetical protein [Flammeovirga kamogawensis]QWG10543.1 T9SS type A sorting domain-containing protein [Flammeovirga kamogawensis]TRX63651.1 T9SS type A sorting domain-containing protein [Flammeovirga kamogawensis]
MFKFYKLLLPLLIIAYNSTFATEYYLSSSEGLDQNDGTMNSPWATLEKISSTQLNAGDKVFFKRGDRFNGHFVINGSGNSTAHILITSYGTGAKPIISGEVGEQLGGDYKEAILVENNDYIIFEDLEIHNERLFSRSGVPDDDAYGIFIYNSGTSNMSNLIFRNLVFKKVYAPKPILKDEGEDAFNGLEVSGITFYTTKNTVAGKEKHIKDVLLEDCYFSDLQRLGVHIKHLGGNAGVGNDSINANMNFVFRNNEFHHTGGTCILPIRTYNCLIENNLFNYPGDNSDPRMPNRGSSVWTWRCFNTIIQYNKCLHIRGYLDSHGVHVDHENYNTFIQYNYMEDCEGGFVEILGGNVNAVYRYNISKNDGWRSNPGWANSNHTIWINEKVPGDNVHHSDSSYIYNNTVYMDSAYSTSIDINAKNTYIFNNIFYVKAGNIGGKQMVIKNNDTPLFMSNNLFYGTVRSSFKNLDSNKFETDPSIVTFEGDDAFKLSDESSIIGKGVDKKGPPIPGAGTGIFKHIPAYPDVDFYGHLLDPSSRLIGAVNRMSDQEEKEIIVVVEEETDTEEEAENDQDNTDEDQEDPTDEEDTDQDINNDTDQITAIPNQEQQPKVVIYPNPNNDKNVFIGFEKPVNNAQVTFLAMDGKVILSEIISGELINIKLDKFRKGIYIVQILTNYGKQVELLIVK